MRALLVIALASATCAGVLWLRPAPAASKRPHKTAAQSYWTVEGKYTLALRSLGAALRREGRLGSLLRAERRRTRTLQQSLARQAHAATKRLRTLQVHSDAPTLAYAIRLASTVYGVPRAAMYAVARCESHLDRYARNGIYRSYWQEGPMFERSRFGRAGFVVWDPIAAALSTAETVAREGWRQWECKP